MARVAVESYKDNLRLRWSYQRQRYCLSIGLRESKINRIVAEGRARVIELDMASGHFDPTLAKYRPEHTKAPPIAVIELFNKFLEFKSKTGLNRRTLEKYRGLVGHLGQYFQQRKAAAVMREDAEGFRAWLLARPLAPVTVRERIGLLSACWQWAEKKGLLDGNVWGEVKVRVPVKQRPNPFTTVEAKQIIQAFREHSTYIYYADYVEFLLSTGCRPGEAIGLRWKHLSDDCSQIWIWESFSRGERKEPKNNRDRGFDLNPRIQALLIGRKPAIAVPDDLVFATPGGKPIDDHNFRNRAWKPILEQLGIEYRKPYTTRSTAASHLLAVGMTPAEVASITGHDVAVLYRHYAGSIKGRQQIPDFLGG